jgi:signal transduction histidine kinase/CheY-like chemotaxis protein
MLHTSRTEKLPVAGDTANLTDLRGQLISRMALLLIGASGLMMWLALTQDPFPVIGFTILAIFLGLGLAINMTTNSYPVLARHLLVWGPTLVLLVAIDIFPDPWLPFLALLPIFINAMLIPGSELVTAGVVVALAAWLGWSGIRVYPLPGLILALSAGVAVAWLMVNTLYTTLHWTQNMKQRADRLLAEVRNHRAELSRALKSSEIANSLLRRTQRELVNARKQAEQARRMKEQFAANISHELRTPLNLVLGFSEMMHLSPEVYGEVSWSPTLRRDVYQIYRSSRHLIGMIDDILDLSRFEMAEFTLNKELTSLDSLLEDVSGIVTNLFRGQPVQLQVDIASDLPALEIDRTRIRQVLLNLLNNAHRFTQAGTVRLAASQTESEVVISVSDTGPGIPADKLPHVFDEFYQVDLSLRRSHQGAGLGLAISKRFVQMHGGTIGVESQAGQGSTFFFSLPKLISYIPATSSPKSDMPEPYWPDGRLPLILVVDPDPTVAVMIHRRFEGYEVKHIQQVEQLGEAIILHHPRAVICNVPPGESVRYPDMATLSVPLIECSLPSQAWLADDLAVVGSLSKPIMAEDLVGTLDKLGQVDDILLIDDDRGFAQLVERMLQAHGKSCHMRRAYDGEEGLLAMRAQPPDLVLLDLMMPVKDGFQVLAEMKQTAELADIPVVLLTATSFAEDALEQRASRLVISRPGGLQPGEVLAYLREVIELLEPHYDEALTPDYGGYLEQEAGTLHHP